MELKFSKYQGTGNDFVIIDGIADRSLNLKLLELHVAKLCDRRFGIGADGLIIITEHTDYDFEMIYYNSDGKQSSMCGNGGRCIVHYAFSKSYIGSSCTFLAIDGLHKAKATMTEVSLQMQDVSKVVRDGDAYVLNTGSPHYVYIATHPSDGDFIDMAKKIRYGHTYGDEGINVNCLQKNEAEEFSVLTYERGVEDITYSCGTGVVASAIANNMSGNNEGDFRSEISTRGGTLYVEGISTDGIYKDLWLIGPAVHIFNGTITLQNTNPSLPKLH